jgi:hypothetical protein
MKVRLAIWWLFYPACAMPTIYQLPSRVNSLSLPLVQKTPVTPALEAQGSVRVVLSFNLRGCLMDSISGPVSNGKREPETYPGPSRAADPGRRRAERKCKR